MLSHLFGSNARVKILKTFLFHPRKKFYIRQLSRDLKLQINSVRRELENLEKLGLLISTTSRENENANENGNEAIGEGNKNGGTNQEKKYYQANTDFVLFEELRNLIVKAQILHKEEFTEKIKKAGKIKLLVLSGAFVNNPESPIDILVVGKFEREKVTRLIKSLQKEMGRELNYTLLDLKEFKYRRDMTDVFLYGVLEGKKIIAIDELGIS